MYILLRRGRVGQFGELLSIAVLQLLDLLVVLIPDRPLSTARPCNAKVSWCSSRTGNGSVDQTTSRAPRWRKHRIDLGEVVVAADL